MREPLYLHLFNNNFGYMIAMKDDDKRREDIDIDATTFSFQSAERRNVYQYLRLTFPDWASIGDIANNIGSDYGNVKGALRVTASGIVQNSL